MKPGQPLLVRALNVYSVYGVRSDPLAKVRALLPKGLTVVGFMGTCDDIDISLWRPFGSRRVKHILLSDSPEQIRQRHIQYAVVGEVNLLENQTDAGRLAEADRGGIGGDRHRHGDSCSRGRTPGMSCGSRIERAPCSLSPTPADAAEFD